MSLKPLESYNDSEGLEVSGNCHIVHGNLSYSF